MKFAALLRTAASAGQLPHLADVYKFYKDTKKQIKALALQGALRSHDGQPMTEPEAQLVQLLSWHVGRWNDAYLDIEEISVMKLQHYSQQMAGLAAYSDAPAWQLYKEVVNFHGETLLTMHWGQMAYTAVVKVLKKYHKRSNCLLVSPALAQLHQEPFCSTEIMSDVLAKVEALSRQLLLRIHAASNPSSPMAKPLDVLSRLEPPSLSVVCPAPVFPVGRASPGARGSPGGANAMTDDDDDSSDAGEEPSGLGSSEMSSVLLPAAPVCYCTKHSVYAACEKHCCASCCPITVAQQARSALDLIAELRTNAKTPSTFARAPGCEHGGA